MWNQCFILLVSISLFPLATTASEVLCSRICSQLSTQTQPGEMQAEGADCKETCEKYLSYAFKITNEKRASKTHRGSFFARIGKSVSFEGDELQTGHDEKRASSFVRIGRAPTIWGIRKFTTLQPPTGKSSDESVTGLDDVSDNEKRASSFVRIGRSLRNDVKRSSSFVRIGKDSFQDNAKRVSSFTRIGKSLRDNENKRASSFVRIGKSESNDAEAKRASSFVRIGKSSSEDDEEKRASSFVRIGKSDDVSTSDKTEEKRASSFVRIGKSLDHEDDKRASSFVRIGKSDPSDSALDLETPQRRASSFVRIGRNTMPGSFEDGDETLPARYSKGSNSDQNTDAI